MEEIKLNFFKRIFYSISNFKVYTQFAKESLGKAFIYLIFFSLIFGTVWVIRPIYDFNVGIGTVEDAIVKDSPDFTFQNGKLSINGEMPIIVGDANNTVIFDTTGKTDETALKNYTNAVLFTADKIIIKEPGRTNTTDLSSLSGLTVTKADLEKWLPLLKFVSIFIAVFGIIFFFMGKIIAALILSLLALIVSSVNNTKLSYSNLLGISIYSLTLASLLEVLLGAVNISIGGFWINSLVFYAISAVFIIMGINEIKKERNELVAE
jgi:hypothetical protein